MTRHWRLTAACLSALAIVGCKAAEPPPFNPRQLERAEREAPDTGVEERVMPPLPSTLQSPFPEEDQRGEGPPPTTGVSFDAGPTVYMTLQEIVQRAVANSLDVKVAGYAPAIDETRVVEAEARFDPTFFIGGQIEHRDRTAAGGSAFGLVGQEPFNDEANIYTLQTGIRQLLSSGGQVELRQQNSRSNFSPSRFNPEPYYESELVLQVTQPLLRDFGNEVNRARISIARNNQKSSLLDFRVQLERTLSDLEERYWQLARAQREVRIQEELLDRTNSTALILLRRADQDVTRLQISQANAEVENRRGELVRAKARVRDISDQIKRLMNDPDMPVTSGLLILPADDEITDPIHFDLQDQINTAMANRPELGQQMLRVDSASIASRVARNNLLPQLNLVGSVGVQGLNGDIGGSVEDQVGFSNISYTLGLQMEIPIGNRAARAIYSRAIFQRQQAIDQYEGITKQVALEVKLALREVRTAWDEMVQSGRARFAAGDALEAIQQREEAQEPLTPEFVDRKLRQQEILAQAQRGEAAAIANYNTAIMRLEQAKGTLLRYNNVIMAEHETPLLKTYSVR